MSSVLWILLLISTGSGSTPAQFKYEFKTEESCIKVRDEIYRRSIERARAKDSYSAYINGVCVPINWG